MGEKICENACNVVKHVAKMLVQIHKSIACAR